MSDHKEKLSAFMDDALEQHEHDELLQVDDASTVSRYSMIGDAMRGEVNEASLIDVRQAVSEAVAGESIEKPAAVTPQRQQKERRSWFDLSSWMQPVGGLAIAASVAMVAVVVLDQPEQAGIVPGAGSVTAEMSPAVRVDAAATTVAESEVTPQQTINLDEYIDAHSEFAASDTLQGRLPYVRAVGYKSR